MKLVKIKSDSVSIKSNSDELDYITINDLLLLQDENYNLVAMVNTLTDNEITSSFYDDDFIGETGSLKIIECNIIGCLKDGKFSNSIENYPTSKVNISEISKDKFSDMLSEFQNGFCLGDYTSYGIPAFVNGNKFFQRHACILGNTGSGKSETIAKLLEQINTLENGNIIVFDIHGEYKNLSFVENYAIGKEIVFPYWFFSLQDIMSNLLKIKEETAVTIPSAIRKAFKEITGGADTLKPSKFEWTQLLKLLDEWDNEVIITGYTKEGIAKTKQGDCYGKLTSVILAMNGLMHDSRYKFMFEKTAADGYLDFLLHEIMSNETCNIKNIDLSNLPHEMIIPVIGTLTKLMYQKHLESPLITPVTVVCDEAHIYIPNNYNLTASERRTVECFEIIAKEGRKFGFTLLVASQRPSELNQTIIAQCGNFVIGKINNDNDKLLIKGMLPDGISNIIESVTMFNAGDILVLGDAVPIALKIHVNLAKERPDSRTIDFWDLWHKKGS